MSPGECRIEIPAPVLELGVRVRLAGGALFIVGGWVRDALLGHQSSDIDLATDLDAPRIKQALSGMGSIYDIGEKYGTVGMCSADFSMEVTTFRRDEYSPGSRHPRVTMVPGIVEDLARRDFTINAMALEVIPEPGRLVDPYGGDEDIRQGLIRTPSDPVSSMTDDPLRMMRAARFAAQLGYRVDPALHEVINARSELLADISCERRRDELEKTLVSRNAAAGLRLMIDTGLMEYVSTELMSMKGVDQPRNYHRANLLEHTLLTVEYLPSRALLRRAALFHDVGKPSTRVTEPKIMFPGHQKVGADLTSQAMKRLRYPRVDTETTAFLVREHMRPILYRPDWSDAAIRRLVRDCTFLGSPGVLVGLEEVALLARADILAGSYDTVEPNLKLLEELLQRVDAIRSAHDHEIEFLGSPLDGHDIMTLAGRGPGPWIKEVKDHLAELVIEGVLAPGDREKALELAAGYLEIPPDRTPVTGRQTDPL